MFLDSPGIWIVIGTAWILRHFVTTALVPMHRDPTFPQTQISCMSMDTAQHLWLKLFWLKAFWLTPQLSFHCNFGSCRAGSRYFGPSYFSSKSSSCYGQAFGSRMGLPTDSPLGYTPLVFRSYVVGVSSSSFRGLAVDTTDGVCRSVAVKSKCTLLSDGPLIRIPSLDLHTVRRFVFG